MLFSGTEDWLRLQALRELQAHSESDPYDTQMIVANDQPPKEWIASVSTVPFLSERRTLIVRNVLRAHPLSQLLPNAVEALKALPDTARLILVADEEVANDSNQTSKHTTARTNWEKVVKEAGGLVLQFKIDPKALKSEVREAAARWNREIDDRAADLLLEMTSRNLSRALEELEKLVLYVEEDQPIRERIVAEVVMPSREWSVFKLVDSMLEGNVSQALTQLHHQTGSGQKSESAAMANILPNLSRTLRLIWQARVCIENRVDPTNLPANVLALLAENPSLAKASDWQRRKLMGAAKKLSFRQIAECLEAVARTDARLKGMETAFSAPETLERMVLEMVETIRPSALAKR